MCTQEKGTGTSCMSAEHIEKGDKEPRMAKNWLISLETIIPLTVNFKAPYKRGSTHLGFEPINLPRIQTYTQGITPYKRD